MKLTSETKFFLGIIIATLVLIGGAAFFLTKPTPTVTLPKETLIAADTHTFGNASASATLVEFSDFQCPACKAYSQTVATLREKYKDKLLFAYHHFPLPQHNFAKVAAASAEAAGKQNKFWEAEKLLFSSQDKFSDDFFTTEFPKLLELKADQYDKDRKDKAVTDFVEDELNLGNQLGISATPTFFLNGTKLGVTSPEELVTEVEKEVNK